MKKSWFITKIIFFIGVAIAMFYFGIIYMEAAVMTWFSWKTILGLVGALWFYIWGYKGCRLAIEEIVKEMTK